MSSYTKAKSKIKEKDIVVHGAKTHNLKNITAVFPRNKFIVVTGVSGSGKSSLTMNTLFAEGQRKYAESLSSYARQFLMRMDKPEVDYITGLCPAIAIEQKVTTRTTRSTVGSMTEIQDYLRLLYSRIGITYSPISGKAVKKDDVSVVVDDILAYEQGSKIMIMVPLNKIVDRTLEQELDLILQRGFTRIYDKKENAGIRIEDFLESDTKRYKHDNINLLIDRIVTKESWEEDEIHRISDSIQTAFYEGQGNCMISVDDGSSVNVLHYNNRFELDGITFEEPTPNFFSYNNPYGACPRCEGFGKVLGLDLDLVIPDKRLSVYEGAVMPWKGEKMGLWLNDFIIQEGNKGFPIHKPVQSLDKKDLKVLHDWIYSFFQMVNDNLYKIQYRIMQARYRGKTDCPECGGSRLRKDALYVEVNDKDISQLSMMPISALSQWFEGLQLSELHQSIAKRILLEIKYRLDTMLGVGLHYLTLDRLANTLSGGESQRIQLTRFLGSNLTDALYILDEPSIGLHPRDTENLVNVLIGLRDLNNTVIVVEHDDMMMRRCDHIIDMGPLAAHLGGTIVAEGTAEEIMQQDQSLTGQYLSGKKEIPTYNRPLLKDQHIDTITIAGCRENNLKDVTVSFPLNKLVAVSGVSGSGKTTLVKHTLYPALMRHYKLGTDKPGAFDELSGDLKKIKLVELIDQNPLGKSSRSNPVTYIKAYDDIRSIFANTKMAKIQGLEPKHFSFNVDGGRCDHCKGEGVVNIEMQFLADVHLECEVCKGKRFKDEVLNITYASKNIYEVLEMSVDEAILFFQDEKNLIVKLRTLSDVGLGYIKLGQSSDTLSGGEAQRVKLASYLGKGNPKEKVLFIFDEPTTGLHFHDISKLLTSFYALLDKGHSIIVVEHNTDVLRNVDWIIDIGPEGGDKGGYIVYEGDPKGLKKVKESYTGRYL